MQAGGPSRIGLILEVWSVCGSVKTISKIADTMYTTGNNGEDNIRGGWAAYEAITELGKNAHIKEDSALLQVIEIKGLKAGG